MVLYSLTKFGIFQSCTNHQWLRRFDKGFWQTWKQIYRKLRYGEKNFGTLQTFSLFPGRMVLYSPTKFAFFNLLPIFSHSEDSSLALGRLQHKFVGNSIIKRSSYKSLKVSLPSSKKIVSYFSRKFYIFELPTNIQALKTFH